VLMRSLLWWHKHLDLSCWAPSCRWAIIRQQLATQHRPLHDRANRTAIAAFAQRLQQLPIVVTACIPLRLQLGNLLVKDPLLARWTGDLWKGVAGHIFAHTLAADMQLAGNLNDRSAIRLQPLHLGIPLITPLPAGLLLDLIQGATAPVSIV